jgi:DNA polymerase
VKDVEDLIPALLAGGDSPGMEALVSLLRSMVVPAPGHRFMSGDYSQIELRMLAWLSGGTYIDHPYHRMAGRIYDVEWETIEKDTVEYGIGKNAELGCGYGMGWKKYKEYVYTATGTTPDDALAKKAVKAYRDSHPFVIDFWNAVEDTAKQAVLTPGVPHRIGRVRYVVQGQFLWCILPSGRGLAYALPRLKMQETPWGEMRPAIVYQGIDSRKGSRVWGPIQTYGGHLVENIVQAAARDVMAESMPRLDAAGYPIVLTVHDEILAEVPNGTGSLEEFQELLVVKPSWGRTAPIEAECWEGDRWRK